MAKIQTRKSISVRGTTYVQLKRYCERNGISMSEFIEERISMFFGNGGSKSKGNTKPRRMTTEQIHDAVRTFTF